MNVLDWDINDVAGDSTTQGLTNRHMTLGLTWLLIATTQFEVGPRYDRWRMRKEIEVWYQQYSDGLTVMMSLA